MVKTLQRFDQKMRKMVKTLQCFDQKMQKIVKTLQRFDQKMKKGQNHVSFKSKKIIYDKYKKKGACICINRNHEINKTKNNQKSL
jgi:hypothetical protein